MKYLNPRPNTTDGKIEIIKGDNRPVNLNHKSDGVTSNLTQTRVVLTIRDKKELDATPVKVLDSGDSPAFITVGSTSPNIILNVDEVCELPEKLYYYDLKFIDSNDKEHHKIINTLEIVARNR